MAALDQVVQPAVTYSPDLIKGQTTHCIAATTAAQQQTSGSSKLAAAQAWGVPVVSLDWLETSLQQQRLLPATPYLILAQGPAQSAGLSARSCVQDSGLDEAPVAVSATGSSASVHPWPSPAQALAQPRRQLSRLHRATTAADLAEALPIEVVRKAVSETKTPAWAQAEASPERAAAGATLCASYWASFMWQRQETGAFTQALSQARATLTLLVSWSMTLQVCPCPARRRLAVTQPVDMALTTSPAHQRHAHTHRRHEQVLGAGQLAARHVLRPC